MNEPNTYPLITDWISSLSSLASAIFVVVGLFIAKKQIGTWRDQAIASKKVELAEAILSSAYEVKDVFDAARNPFSSIPADQANNPLYIFQQRGQLIQDHSEAFDRLRRSQVRVKILALDPKIEQAITAIFEVRRDFWLAIALLTDSIGMKDLTDGEKIRLKEARATVFSNPGSDQINNKLNDALAVLSELLGEVVRQHR